MTPLGLEHSYTLFAPVYDLLLRSVSAPAHPRSLAQLPRKGGQRVLLAGGWIWLIRATKLWRSLSSPVSVGRFLRGSVHHTMSASAASASTDSSMKIQRPDSNIYTCINLLPE